MERPFSFFGCDFCLYCLLSVVNLTFRKKMDIKVTSSDSNAKKANLYAAKKERVKLPTYRDCLEGTAYHISEFLSHPSGIEAVLNTRALQSFQSLGANTYRSSTSLTSSA